MNFRSSHLSLAVVLLACLSVSARAQAGAAAWSEWETLSPEGEEFSVLMPKGSTAESGKFPYHKMELTGRLYLSSVAGGPLVAVASFSGIKSAPALYSDFERFNSYVDVFKNWFPGKVRGKDAVVKLIPTGTKMFHGYSGREFKLTIGDLSGTVQAYATRKRFYAIVSLNTKPDATLQEKFLSSFVLPDRPPDEKKQATAENNGSAEIEAPPAPPATDQKRSDGTPNTNPQNRAGEDNTESGAGNTAGAVNQGDSSQPKAKRAPIAGGILNGKAIYLPMPDVPAGEATGVVMVQVIIDEQGSVSEARVVSGPNNLHASALIAARLARFAPTMLMGEPVRVSGTLSYSFVKSN